MNRHALLALVSLTGGVAGLSLLLEGRLALALLSHLVAAAVGWYAAVLSDSRRLGGHWFQAAMSLCVPFFGGAAAFHLSRAVRHKKSGSLSEDFAVYLNDAASFRESVPVTDAEAPAAEDLVPLADILANPVSEAEQRIAVENLVSMETPSAMAILRQVIDSDSGEGRFFAMTALAQMEEKLLARLQRQEEYLAAGHGASAAALILTARTYVDFTSYRLAQDSRRREYLVRAGELLQQALELDAADGQALLFLGRVRMLQEDAWGALACFNPFLEKNPDSQPGFLWRAEAWYMVGDYERVKADCQRARLLGTIPGAVGGAAAFWIGGDRVGDDLADCGQENGLATPVSLDAV